jgi:F0F1-type ATP synthase membrane subunit b/b'
VRRRLALIALAVGTLTLAAAGCAGDEESSVCGELEDIQATIEDLRGIELDAGALEEAEQAIEDIRADAEAARADAEEELGDEVEEFQAAVETVEAELEAAVTAPSIASVQAVATAVSGALASFDALREATPDCDR